MPLSDRTCLVTGGSGFLGVNLVRRLLAAGRRVRTLDIEPFDAAERDREFLQAHLGDVRDPHAVLAAVQGVEAIVHAAAALPLADAREVWSTNVEGTHNVLEAALRVGVRRVVFISSTAVYGLARDHPADEDAPLCGVGPYGESKIAAEAACAAARARGLCVTVLRPKTFIGPERRGVFELLYEWAAEGRSFPILGRGDNLYQLLDVEDLCGLIERCLALDVAAVNQAFNVGATEFGTMREIVQTVLDRAGHGRRAVSLPAGPARAALWLLRALHLSPLYPWIYETADRDSRVAVERARRVLGFAPRHSNRMALTRNYEWYLAHRGSRDVRRGVSHRARWPRGALALARHLF